MKRTTSREFIHDSHGDRLRVKIRTGSDSQIPLLICGGFGVPLDVLDPFVESMDEAGIIRFDPPGIGGSKNRYLPYSFSQLSQILNNLLDRLGCDQVDILGISWGGMLAQEFALKFPERCRKLILASTLSGIVSIPGNLLLGVLSKPKKWFLEKKFSKSASLLYGGQVLKKDWWDVERYLAIYPTDLPGYLGQLSAAIRWTSIHRLHKVSQPVLLLYGRDDSIIPMINAKILQKFIPDARLIQFDCGHLFPWTHRDQICREISIFRR